MEKDITILDFIERLRLRINFNAIKIVDFWESDLCSIGIMKENKLIYISTFNYVDDEKLMYDFDLEILDKDDNENINVVKEGRNIGEEELMHEIKIFLSDLNN
ncbi:hypothetical protein M2306_001388 [Myroides gitamensis]|uniref:hypothetical protein n=1 Tax=Myroides odoratus TaxID=256 RepID=UPI00216852B7|nr:hypothetical protein [Myroides odoratus]MCS4238492.1 hypothetical protein [Myroides odoratus]MDH6600694.1 hypothetical protein [Myroides gitamensis]